MPLLRPLLAATKYGLIYPSFSNKMVSILRCCCRVPGLDIADIGSPGGNLSRTKSSIYFCGGINFSGLRLLTLTLECFCYFEFRRFCTILSNFF